MLWLICEYDLKSTVDDRCLVGLDYATMRPCTKVNELVQCIQPAGVARYSIPLKVISGD